MAWKEAWKLRLIWLGSLLDKHVFYESEKNILFTMISLTPIRNNQILDSGGLSIGK